jgi:hypothetical protein
MLKVNFIEIGILSSFHQNWILLIEIEFLLPKTIFTETNSTTSLDCVYLGPIF